MKKFLLFTLAISAFFFASATDRGDEEMRSIALSELVQPSAKSLFPTNFRVDRLREFNEFNVYGNEDAFVLVSRDDRFPAVLGVSYTPFDLDNMPEGLQWYLRAADESLKARRELADTTGEEYVAFAQTPLFAEYTPVENFLKTRWDQDDPYNALCPKIKGSLPPCGCVATAMGQILYYYQYPSQGHGTGYYSTNNGAKLEVEINGTYDWSNIKAQYGASITESQRNAVAQLLRDCGYASHMDYAMDGSGTNLNWAAWGYVYNFDYDSLAIRQFERDLFVDSEWMKIVYDQLSAKQPILYGGVTKSNAGHAFVFSGFQADGKVYVNWGWNGSGNGYFDINVLNSSQGSFSEGQDMVYGFRTNPVPTSDETFESLIGLDGAWSLSLSGSNIRFEYPTFYNYHFQVFHGTLNLVFQDTENPSDIAYIQLFKGQLDHFRGSGGGTKRYKPSDLQELPAGTYRVYLASKHPADVVPQPARVPGEGAYFYEVTKKSDGSFAVGEKVNFADAAPLDVDTYALTYLLNGEEYKTYRLPEGADITPEPAPTKPGYTFGGWSDPIPSVMPAHDVTINGTLIANPKHKLTYYLNGNVYKVQSVPEGAEIEPAEVTVIDGYIFTGWGDMPTYMPASDVDVYGWVLSQAKVETSDAGYATFYDSSVDYVLPEGLKAYIVTEQANSKVKYVLVADGDDYSKCVIDHGTAVLLEASDKAANSYLLTQSLFPSGSTPTGNLLFGSDEDGLTTGVLGALFYKLAYGDQGSYQQDVFGWYWGAENGAAFTSQAHRAWLAVPKATAAKLRFLPLPGSEEAIEETQPADAADVVYDLQGRRVSSPTRRGIYIINGKKQIIK